MSCQKYFLIKQRVAHILKEILEVTYDEKLVIMEELKQQILDDCVIKCDKEFME